MKTDWVAKMDAQSGPQDQSEQAIPKLEKRTCMALWPWAKIQGRRAQLTKQGAWQIVSQPSWEIDESSAPPIRRFFDFESVRVPAKA